MAQLSLNLQIVDGTQATISNPEKPVIICDTKASDNVPVGMSAENRAVLRSAGLEWSGTLGGFFAKRHSSKAPAAYNMDHFLNGEGEGKTFCKSEVEEL